MTGDANPSIVAIVQARMTSSRLPGKSLATLAGKPVLRHVIERLKRSETLDTVAVATSSHPSDAPIVALAERLGVPCAAGSLDDVLDRYLIAARALDATVIVRVTGDCPLIDPGIVDEVVRAYLAGPWDYASNAIERSAPIGADTEVFSIEALVTAAAEATEDFEREHVTPFLYGRPGRFRICHVPSTLPRREPPYRLCLDTQEDLALLEAIFARLGPENGFSIADVVALLDREPELAAINAQVKQKTLGE